MAQMAPGGVHTNLLPAGGTLFFFYDAEGEPWYGDSESGACRVLSAEAGAQLARAPLPPGLSEAARLGECAVETRQILTLPPYDSSFVTGLGLSDDERDLLSEFQDALDDSYSSGPAHQVLGHPRVVQGDMANDLPDVGEPWVLLFQLDSDEAAAVMWADGGKLYFWIPASDLKQDQFDRVRVILQSC